MGNVFDQFDSPTAAPAAAANPFDQFDPRANRAGLAARTGIQGLVNAAAGLPAMLTDYALSPGGMFGAAQSLAVPYINRAMGTDFKPVNPDLMKYTKMVGPAAERLATAAGTPQPQTPGERLAVDVGTQAIGALGPAGFGRAALATGAKAIAPLAARLAATPVLDFMSGAAGAGGQEIARNMGGGEGAQTAAGFGASVIPAIAAAVGRRAITPLPSTLTATQQRLVGVLQNEGVPLSAGQQVGNIPLKYMESQVSQLPGGSLLAENPTANQSQNLVQAALRHAGVDATAATPEVLNKAHADIGGEIGSIIQGKTFIPDSQFQNDLKMVEKDYARRLPTDKKPVIQSYLDDLQGMRFKFTGDIYQKTRTNIGTAIREQNGPQGNKDLQRALIDVRDSMDSLVDRSLFATDPAAVENLAAARQKYANLLTIEDAVARSGSTGARGELDPSALFAAAKASQGARQVVRGFGDLTSLGTAAKALLPSPSNSGTATRAAPYELARNIITGGSIGYGVGGTPGALIGGAVSGGLPALGGALVNSPLMQAYYRNQLLPGPALKFGYGAIPGLLGGQ